MHTVKLSDGIERELKTFSIGMVRRMLKRLDLQPDEIGKIPVDEIIFEGLVDRGELTPEAIADLIPLSRADEISKQAMCAILDKSPEQLRAMEAAAGGSDSGNPTLWAPVREPNQL